MTARTRRAGWAAVAACTAVATAWGASAQASSPSHQATQVQNHANSISSSLWKSKTAGLDRSTPGRTAYFVQLRGAGAIGSGHTAPSKVLGARAAIQGNAARAFTAARSADAHATKLYTTTNLVPGFAVTTTAAGVKALASRPDVVKVSRIIPKTATNANTANLVRALQTWKYSGDTGKGVKVGIIDTGLDYTHADFGGTGTPAAYADAKATDTESGWRDSLPALGKAKIIGGYDFAGDDYDADPTADTYQPVPHPDANPLDCNEHGTHVAGTAAGYGVNANGTTFAGNYAKVSADRLMSMKVGPGMAPQAQLYSLKVFGCEGSTDLVIDAMDRAMDPNGDGDTSDHFDMINMSLGSDFGRADDPENLVVNRLAAHGVLPVISMGNGGDLTDIGGAPGNAQASLAVASSVDSYQLRDGLTVNAPAGVAGTAAGQFSIAYDWANKPDVTGDVAKIPGTFGQGNTDGCDTLTTDEAAAVAGKIAWLYWDDNDSTRQCGSAARAAKVEAAGAIGAIYTSSLDVFGAGITGSATIPVMQLPKAQVDRLTPAVDAGTLNVTFDGSQKATIKDVTPSISDTLSSFSSRGPHGSTSVVKPDVAAPGDTIASAGMGTGNDVLVISGTSMASPLVAGVSALVKSSHPSWSPLFVKAAVMNTATHDVWTGPSKTGHRYAPARVGNGRVDAKAAVGTKVLAYVQGTDNPVSASFGVVPAVVGGGKVVKQRTLVIRNLSTKSRVYKVGYDAVNPSPGVTYSFSKTSVSIKAGGKAEVTVTMSVSPTGLRHTLDPTMERDQLGVARQFVTDSSGHIKVTPQNQAAIRVPVYGAAKPVSNTTATGAAHAINLSGQGVAQGSGSATYLSIASVMQLGATSPAQPECPKPVLTNCWDTESDHAGDIQYTGAGVSPGPGQLGDDDEPYLYFGISTYHDWANTDTMTPYVDIDTGGTPAPDLEIYLQNADGSDVLLAWTVNYSTGEVYDVEPVNGLDGSLDSNVFDTNTVLLPMDLAVVADSGGPDLTGAHAPITYSAGTFNGYTGDDQDHTATADFDVAAPDLSTDTMLWGDAGDSMIPVAGSGQALVFHLRGASGHRAQVVTVTP